MKKAIVYLLIGTMMLSITACGKKSENANGTEQATVTEGANEYGTVDLCTYKGLEAEKSVHEITDEEVQEEIESIIDENQETVKLDRGIKDGDYVEFYFTAKVDSETIYDFSEEVYYMTAGEEEFGEEFDKQIDGAKAKDHKTFSIKYDGQYWDEQLQNKSVDYDVTIDGVYEIKTPELTEEFIKDTLGYESEEDMRKQVKQQLQEQYDSTAEYNVQTELLQNVIENSNVTKYEEGLYDKFKEQVQEEYEASKEMFGFETVEEVYESMGMTEEDIEDEILYYIYETVVVQQIANEEGLSISDEEYKEGLNTYAINAEYESADSYEQEMGADNIRFWLLEDKVMKFLADNAKITEVEGKSLSEQQGFDGGEEEIEGIDETEIEDLGLSDEEIIIDGTEE